MSVEIHAPEARTFVVRWKCRRCGYTGVAKTTIPLVTKEWTEDMMRNLFDALRNKLVKVHMRGQNGCIPVVDDFIVERGTPEDARIVGLV